MSDPIFGEVNPDEMENVNKGATLHVKDGGDHVLYLHPIRQTWMRVSDSVNDYQCNAVERFARNIVYMRRRCPPRFRKEQREVWHQLAELSGAEGWQTTMVPLMERFCIVTSMLHVFENWEMDNLHDMDAFFDVVETQHTSRYVEHRYADRAVKLAREQRQLAGLLGLTHRTSFAMMDRKMLIEAMKDDLMDRARRRMSHNDDEWNSTMLPTLNEVHKAEINENAVKKRT